MCAAPKSGRVVVPWLRSPVETVRQLPGDRRASDHEPMSLDVADSEATGHDHGGAADLEVIAHRLTARRHPVGHEMAAAIRAELPDLAELEPSMQLLLQQAVDAEIDAVVTGLIQRIDPDDLESSVAGHEYARRLGARDVAAHELVRAHQVGANAFTTRLLEELALAHPERAATVNLVRRILRYTQRVQERSTTASLAAFMDARDARSRAHGAAIARQVSIALAGRLASTTTHIAGYSLAGPHVGLVLWCPDPEHAANLTDPHAALSGHIATMDLLVLAQDEATIHVWAHAAAGAPITLPDKEIAPGWRVAMGSPHAGCEGFVATHGEALSAQRVAHLAGPYAAPVTAYETIAAVSFLAENPERARHWVGETLGALAAPGEEMHRLRETLASYLALGENAAAAGERLFLHRNTVAYRVARARGLLPAGRDADALDLALALRYLAVIPPPPA